ncbi:TPA: EAL domain-containing protein [Escherichia coli]
MNKSEGLGISHVKDELIPYFQPVMGKDDHLCGVEVLARWVLPSGEILSPDCFINPLKHAGLDNLMTEILLEKAAGILVSVRGSLPDMFSVSFNLDAPVHDHESVIRSCTEFRKTAGSCCNELICELTERAPWLNDSAGFLDELREEGIKIALDDFGTGFSTLSLLEETEANYIKLDRHFISNISYDPSSWKMAECVIFIAKKYSTRIIAEGVETALQSDWLRSRGVDLQQGYYFSPPVDADMFIRHFINGKYCINRHERDVVLV